MEEIKKEFERRFVPKIIRGKTFTYDWDKEDLENWEWFTETIKAIQMQAKVKVQIAEIIDKEIEIQKKIEKHIEQVETGERLRQMRLISQSKRIAHEEIKKELLSNLSA